MIPAAPQPISLRTRLSGARQALELARQGWPHADEEAARLLAAEILSTDPDVHGPALAALDAQLADLGACYCASCSHVLHEIPAVAKCPVCGSQYLKRRT